MTKTCTKCNKEKPLEEFYRDRYSASGLTHRCKACCREHAENRRRKDPEKNLRETRESVRRIRAEAQVSAENRGRKWTIQELKWIATADEGQSLSSLARELGRTYESVQKMRSKVRTDPKKARLAGVEVQR